MALPTLATTTSTTGTTTTAAKATTSVSKSLTTQSGKVKTSSYTITTLPSLTSSKSSYTTPVMTVPPSSDNPYITKSRSTSGTVFIAFGAIAVFLLLMTYIAYLINSWRLRREALNHQLAFDSEYKGGYNYIPDQQQQQQQNTAVPLLRNEHSDFNLNSNTSYQGSNPNLLRPTDVTKMFISPTAEVLNVRNSTMFSDSTTTSPLRGPFDSPTQFQFQHSRDGSRVGGSNSEVTTIRGSGTGGGSALRETRGRSDKKVIPSMYLDDMLENDE